MPECKRNCRSIRKFFFKSHHVTLRPEKMLSKFFIRDATSPRPIPFSLEPNGFYIKFKNRAREVLKNVDIHNPSTRSKLYADFIVTVAILAAIGAARFKSWIFVIVSGKYCKILPARDMFCNNCS